MPANVRIARIAGKPYRASGGTGRTPFEDHATLVALIRRHLPGIVGSLLASPRPVEGSDDVEWYSDLAGQPEPLTSLSQEQQVQVRLLLDDRVAAIRELADRLPGIEPSSAHLVGPLRNALSYPGDAEVYSVGGQPVLTFWGHEDPDARVRAVAPTGVGNASPRILPRALGIAAILLAAVALWFLWPVRDAETPLTLVDETIVMASVAAGPPPSAAPVKPVIDGPVLATRYCAEEKIVATPMVIVYDNSGSMAYPLNMPAAEVDAIHDLYHGKKTAHEQRVQTQAGLNQLAHMFGGNAGSSRPVPAFPGLPRWVAQNHSPEIDRYGPQRMDVAKPLVQKLIDEIPPEIPLGLVAFSDCDRISGQFADAGGAGRAGLKKLIAGLSPDGATPIAASLKRAGAMLDGTSEAHPGLVVLITDGVEYCKGDPCAVAGAIKQAKPWLAVHVVKLGPEVSSSCVAQATGGKLYQPSSVDDLAQAINEARITAPFELGCRP